MGRGLPCSPSTAARPRQGSPCWLQSPAGAPTGCHSRTPYTGWVPMLDSQQLAYTSFGRILLHVHFPSQPICRYIGPPTGLGRVQVVGRTGLNTTSLLAVGMVQQDRLVHVDWLLGADGTEMRYGIMYGVAQCAAKWLTLMGAYMMHDADTRCGPGVSYGRGGGARLPAPHGLGGRHSGGRR